MMSEIQLLALNRHNNVAGLNQLTGSKHLLIIVTIKKHAQVHFH
jgi:hypothetical protein